MRVRFAPWRALEGSARRGEPADVRERPARVAPWRERPARVAPWRARAVMLLASAVALVGGGAVLAPAVATAGTFVIQSCPDGTGWSGNNGPEYSAVNGGCSGYNLGLGPDQYSGNGIVFSLSSSASWVFSAPSPDYISAYTMTGSGFAGSDYPSCYVGGNQYDVCGVGRVTISPDGPDTQSSGDVPVSIDATGLNTGSVTAEVSCSDGGYGNGCPANGNAPTGGIADLSISSASFWITNNTAVPAGSSFTGGLLQADAAGTQNVLFTATDPNGPGVYTVQVLIDGSSVYRGTPNTNGGLCVASGTAGGDPIFTSFQPCPASESVDIPVDTTELTDGSHGLKIVVTDAAGNSSTVYDSTISTLNHAQSSLAPTPPAIPSAASSVAQPPVYGFVLNSATTALGTAVQRTYPKSGLTFSGTLTTGGTVAPAVTVSVWAAEGSSEDWQQLATTTTDGAGRWSLNAPEGSSRELRVVAGSSASPTGSASVVSLTETVTPTLSLKVKSNAGERLVFTGKLGISPLVSPRPLVLIQAKEDGQWQTIGTEVRVNAKGAYTLRYQTSPLLAGRAFQFRATTPATGDWLAAKSGVHKAVVL
jgi:hypothetical protein